MLSSIRNSVGLKLQPNVSSMSSSTVQLSDFHNLQNSQIYDNSAATSVEFVSIIANTSMTSASTVINSTSEPTPLVPGEVELITNEHQTLNPEFLNHQRSEQYEVIHPFKTGPSEADVTRTQFDNRDEPARSDGNGTTSVTSTCDVRLPHNDSLVSLTNDRPDKCFSCSLCDRRFASESGRRHHIKSRHRRREELTCRDCGKQWNTVDELTQHRMSAHYHKKAYECVDCGRLYSARNKLAEHHKRVHQSAGNALECDECGAVLESQSEYRSHMTLAHRPDKADMRHCQACDKWMHRCSFVRHCRLHANDVLCHVQGCGQRVFASRMNAHMVQCHAPARSSSTSRSSSTDLQSAPSTEAHSVMDRSMSVDMSSASGTEFDPRRCPVCHKQFASILKVTRHVKLVHEGKAQDYESSRTELACTHPGCTRTFSIRTKLDAHLNQHLRLTPFQCPQPDCERAYAGREALCRHVTRCHGRRLREYVNPFVDKDIDEEKHQQQVPTIDQDNPLITDL